MNLRWLGAALVAAALAGFPAAAQTFDWKRQAGQTLNLLLVNQPWANAIRDQLGDFAQKTGIRTRVEQVDDEQLRQRVAALIQARSPDVDAFASLASRDGPALDAGGGTLDLAPLRDDPTATAPDFAFDEFAPALRAGAIVNGKLLSLPVNLEGPLFYWRRDVFERCGLSEPVVLEDIEAAAAALKACDPGIAIWAARGTPSSIPYALAGFIRNLGGSFADADGQPALCRPATLGALELYARLLGRFGPPGAATLAPAQVVEWLAQGRLAMTHESSNGFAVAMKFPGREADLGVKVLPPGRAGGPSRPVAIGWGLSINAASPRRAAAWTFLQWATTREVQSRLIQAGVGPSRFSSAYDQTVMKWIGEAPVRQAWIRALTEIGRTGTPAYQTPGTRIAQAREIIGGAVRKLILQEATAQDAACAADQELARIR